MKNILFIVTAAGLLVNGAAGAVLSFYTLFNCLAVTFVILTGLASSLALNSSAASHGLKISFSFLLAPLTLALMGLAALMPAALQDNGWVVVLALGLAMQAVIAVVPRLLTAASQ